MTVAGPGAGTRMLLAGIGIVLLLLAANQLVWQRWVFAAIQGVLGVGLLLAGALSPGASRWHRAAGNLLGIVLWNALFAAGLIAVAAFLDPSASGLLGTLLPYLAALWLLVLGARFASRRAAVVAIAVVSSLLLVAQCAILGAGILLSPYHFEHRVQYQLLLAAAATTGAACVWWFLRAKRSAP